MDERERIALDRSAVKVLEGLPMQLNLSMPNDPRETIGWASAWKREDGTIKLEILLDPVASERLGNLAEVFELKAIGFSGVARRPEKKSGRQVHSAECAWVKRAEPCDCHMAQEAVTNPGGHGWTKPVAPPNQDDRPKGGPMKRRPEVGD